MVLRRAKSSMFFWWRSSIILFFFMQIKPPASFHYDYDSKHKEADEEMRYWFRDLREILAIPILHGISAFGT